MTGGVADARIDYGICEIRSSEVSPSVPETMRVRVVQGRDAIAPRNQIVTPASQAAGENQDDFRFSRAQRPALLAPSGASLTTCTSCFPRSRRSAPPHCPPIHIVGQMQRSLSQYCSRVVLGCLQHLDLLIPAICPLDTDIRAGCRKIATAFGMYI